MAAAWPHGNSHAAVHSTGGPQRPRGRAAADRQNVPAVSPYEPVFGYSRAVRVGDHVFVAGSAAIGPHDETVAIGDPEGQARRALDVINGALQQAGASMEDVVLTRIFLTDLAHAEIVGRVHNEYFHDVKPVTSAVQVAGLLRPEWLVEIEAHAVVGAGASSRTTPGRSGPPAPRRL